MSTVHKIIITGLAFLFTTGTGFWLSNSGKPLNTVLFTVHKLIALAFVVFAAMLIRNMLAYSEMRNLILSLIVISALSIILLFVSGALLSTGKPVSAILSAIHSAAPIVTAISTGLVIYLLTTSRP